LIKREVFEASLAANWIHIFSIAAHTSLTLIQPDERLS
jgi:hypothetical protein